jgi:hypothetical protein
MSARRLPPRGPAGRKQAVEEILRDSADGAESADSAKDVLSEWDRDNFIFADSAQVRIPLQSSESVCRNLKFLIAVAETLVTDLQAEGVSERTKLMSAHMTIRRLNGRINAYRKPRR